MTNRTNRTLADEWTAFARSPDEATFTPIYEATRGIAMAVCRRVLRDEEDARDAFQSTYARLLHEARARPAELAAQEGSGPVARLAGLEANALRKRRARASRRFGERGAETSSPPRRADPMDDSQREPVEPGPGPTELAATHERREKLDAIVSALADPDRIVIQLRYFDGLSLEDVARAAGMPLATAASRIRRALRKLERPMREAGLGDAATVLGAIPIAVSAAGAMGAGLAVGAKLASGTLASGSLGTGTLAGGSLASGAGAAGLAAAAGELNAAAVFAKAATALATGSLEFSTTAGAGAQPGLLSWLFAFLAGMFKAHPVVSTAIALTTFAAPPAVVLLAGPGDPGIVVAPPRVAVAPGPTPDPGYLPGPPLPSMEEIVRANEERFVGVVGYEFEWDSEERVERGRFNNSPPHLRIPEPIPETLYTPPTDLILKGSGRVLARADTVLEIVERERFLPGILPGGLSGVRASSLRHRIDETGTSSISKEPGRPERREYSDGRLSGRSIARASTPFASIPLDFHGRAAWGFLGPFEQASAPELSKRWTPGGWRLADGDMVLEVTGKWDLYGDTLVAWLDPSAGFRTRGLQLSNLAWDFSYDADSDFSALPASLERSGKMVQPETVRLRSRRLFREGGEPLPGDDAFRFPPPEPGVSIADDRGLVSDDNSFMWGVRYRVGEATRFVPRPRDLQEPGPTDTFTEHPTFAAAFDLTPGAVVRFAHPAAHPLPEVPHAEMPPKRTYPRSETEYTPPPFPANAPLRVSLVSVERREEFDMEDEWATFELRYPKTNTTLTDDEWRVLAHLRRGDWASWGEFSIQAVSVSAGAPTSGSQSDPGAGAKAKVRLEFRPGGLLQKPQPDPAMTTVPILQLVTGGAAPEDREALHRYHAAATPLLRRHGLRLLGTHAAPEGSHPREPLVYLLASDSYEAARLGWMALLDDPEFIALRERMNPEMRLLLAWSGTDTFFVPGHLRPLFEVPSSENRAATKPAFEIRRYFQGKAPPGTPPGTPAVPLASHLTEAWEATFEAAGGRIVRSKRPTRDPRGTLEFLLIHPDAARARLAAERLEKDPLHMGPLDAARADGSLVYSDSRLLRGDFP